MLTFVKMTQYFNFSQYSSSYPFRSGNGLESAEHVLAVRKAIEFQKFVELLLEDGDQSLDMSKTF